MSIVDEQKSLKETISELVGQTDINAKQIDEIVIELVNDCCSELDEYVGYVKKILDDTNTPITDVELDDFVMTIPTLLYFVGSAQESMGIREDVAKMSENDKYSRLFIDASGTVQQKQSYAKLSTANETLTTMVFQRASKMIKLRVEAAYEILNSCKKVLSRRVSELELSKSSPQISTVHRIGERRKED